MLNIHIKIRVYLKIYTYVCIIGLPNFQMFEDWYFYIHKLQREKKKTQLFLLQFSLCFKQTFNYIDVKCNWNVQIAFKKYCSDCLLKPYVWKLSASFLFFLFFCYPLLPTVLLSPLFVAVIYLHLHQNTTLQNLAPVFGTDVFWKYVLSNN